MKSFYLSGQRTFENRGCEAIVRSTVQLLKKYFGEIKVLVPSNDIARDSAQWPEAAEQGVEFVRDYMPSFTRYWVHFQRLPIPFLKRAGWPFPFPSWLKDQIKSVDAVLAIGGDNYSLDYRLPSLIMGIDKLAMDMGKPVILWGASVGPFDAVPEFLPTIVKHLSRMDMLAVRETVSYEYLTHKCGLKNVVQMADPAFTLQKQEVDCSSFWPSTGSNGVLGFNVSPLIEKYKKDGQDLRKEVISFIRYIVTKQGMSVLLIPHVTALGGHEYNNDSQYMEEIINEVGDLGLSVRMMPHQFNASQIKYVISKLRYFIGARTHATIAALSSGIPTISIAYSVKAKGINKDLFGSVEPVLPTPELSCDSLIKSFSYLSENETILKKKLSEKVPSFQSLVYETGQRLKNFL